MIFLSRKYYRFFLISSLLLTGAFAQSLTAQSVLKDTTAAEEETEIFEKVEVEAGFPGGDAAWLRYLQQNLNASVPANRKAPVGVYTVLIQFVVDKDGKISNITALTSHGYGMEEEVIRILRKSPRWKPAIQEGRNVKAYRKQPVTFVVMEEEKKKRRNKD